MGNNSLSLCMIVKNEARNLEKCLDSVKNIVDEIIIVDTGSTDTTIEIAHAYGAKVIQYEWEKDFSKARNIGLAEATKQWILILDGDEAIHEEDGEQLKKLLGEETHCAGYYLRLVNIVEGQNQGDSIVFRVLKNDPDYRFEGKMHEQIIGSVERKNGINAVGATDIRIMHSGYDPKQANLLEKSYRNIELLQSYSEDKRDGYYYYSLGNEYTRIGKIEKAKATYEQAFRSTILKKGVMPIYYTYLMKSVLMMHQSIGEYNLSIEGVKKYIKECPLYRELYFYLALAYIQQSQFSKAKEAIKKYQSIPQGEYAYPCSNFEGQYDINNILQQLEQAQVPHADKLISTLIVANKYEPTLIDAIKSAMEISYDVTIIAQELPMYAIEAIEEAGAKVYITAMADREKQLIIKSKKCSGQYLFIMEPGEICSAQSQRDIVRRLEENNKKGAEKAEAFELMIISKTGSIEGRELRIIRNNKKLSNMRSFLRYQESVRVEQTPIYLHHMYKTITPHISKVLSEGMLPFDFGTREGTIQSLVEE